MYQANNVVLWQHRKMAERLKREFEEVEALEDPETGLWSATVNDAEGGLLSLC